MFREHPSEVRRDGTRTTTAGATADAGGTNPREGAASRTAAAAMKSQPGPPMTFGGAAAAAWRAADRPHAMLRRSKTRLGDLDEDQGNDRSRIRDGPRAARKRGQRRSCTRAH